MELSELIEQIEYTAKHCRSIGMSVEINWSLPYVAVNLGQNEHGDDIEYFFQGEEADNLLEEVPDWINEDDYILWSAQGW
jgi:hypothetical protein